MAYYTEEDRERAAAKRKINSQLRQVMESPEDAYDIFGVSVPRVTQKPTLQEYGLSEDIEQRLQRIDEEYVHNEKSRRRKTALIYTAVIISLFIYFTGLSNPATHPENYNNDGTQLTNNFVAYGGGILSIGGFFAIIFLWSWTTEVTPKETSEHSQHKKYKEQLSHYEYWERKKNKDHWNKMTGHGFEQAVANLFRNIGFSAEVSSGGGDGGVDIILQSPNRRIAVQCKRYKSPVGPHVIRDLWGTMNHLDFEEGCIVTTTGFTKGVKGFAEDKNIFLVDLNDILKAAGENGDSYLRRLIDA
jgi:hypothetical protein